MLRAMQPAEPSNGSSGAKFEVQMNASVTAPFVTSTKAPFLILTLANSDGAVAYVLALNDDESEAGMEKQRVQAPAFPLKLC
jgi:hypothetical protein